MGLISLKCSNCGANLEIDDSREVYDKDNRQVMKSLILSKSVRENER